LPSLTKDSGIAGTEEINEKWTLILSSGVFFFTRFVLSIFACDSQYLKSYGQLFRRGSM
jgi:hypothetical protein